MATGKTHAGDSRFYGFTGGIGLSSVLFYQFNTPINEAWLYGVTFGLGSFSGIMLSPDLDVDGYTYAEHYPIIGNIWHILWLPYAKVIPHRSFFSHFPIVGTLLRQLYLLKIVSLFIGLYYYVALQLPINLDSTLTVGEYVWNFIYPHLQILINSTLYWSFFAGLCLSDFIHFLRDK